MLYKTCSSRMETTLKQSSIILNESDESFWIIKSPLRWKGKKEEESEGEREEN